ncbi:MAG: TIGR00282 family metallophosphoesterase [Armatimonadota bacterium]
MRVLVVGDVVGRPGRSAVRSLLPRIVEEHEIHFIIVNAENAAGGSGITEPTARELFEAGAHVLTTGNHVWGQREAFGFVDREERLLRPANFPDGAPGRGAGVYQVRGERVGVVNVQGRTFMQALEDPFRTAEELVGRLREECQIIFVDMHAEATSEKMALARFLDGKVTCVFGTHTHVPTADECILPGGTAYITDVGMTGPVDSIIGMQPKAIIERFLTGLPVRFEVARGKAALHGILVDADERTGAATAIERIRLTQD